MWLFKRKKKDRKIQPVGPPCIYCGSTCTIVISQGYERSGNLKTWRGQRYITCRCLDCGRDFYSDEVEAARAQAESENRMVDDAEALRQAEEELKRKTDEEDDRRFLP
jgi:hypothetical protein